jgi:hypothetical protein
MTKSVKTILIVIGSLSILSSIYLALDGLAFSDYFYGLFIGITLIGSVLFVKEKEDTNKVD